MPRPQLILPQADASCGKTFFADRRTADGHRIALEVWNRATGRVREGYRLAVHRCRRCGGYHVGLRPIERIANPNPTLTLAPARPDRDEPQQSEEWGYEAPRVRRIALSQSAWS
jgi:hypothetical protein